MRKWLIKDEKVYVSSMKDHFKKVFQTEVGLETALSTFDSTFKEILPYKMNPVNLEYELLSNRVMLSDFCLVKIFLIDNLIEFVLFVFVIILLVLGILDEFRKLKQIKIAQDLYKCIIFEIRKSGLVGNSVLGLKSRSSTRRFSGTGPSICRKKTGGPCSTSWSASDSKKGSLAKPSLIIVFVGLF